jgi:hypothetical protein
MKYLFILFTTIIFIVSCNNEPQEIGVYKSRSIGKQGEITIVMHKQLWDSKMGGLANKYLSPDVEYYPQTEKLFDLKHETAGGFNSSSKRHKNIIQFEITDHPKIEEGINYLTDVWAKDQVVIKITGKSQQGLAQLFVDNAMKIRDYITDKDIARIKADIDANKNYQAEKELINMHDIGLTVPADMELAINNKTFAAFERKKLRNSEKNSGYPSGAGDIQEYVLVYHYPYTSDSTFTKEYQIAKRDSVLKIYMEGSIEGSHMITTAEDLAPVFAREKLLKGNYAYELRGQYSMVKDFRGGPFMSISLVDERKGRIITIEGNVFAPKFNKREFMLELETIINSLVIY